MTSGSSKAQDDWQEKPGSISKGDRIVAVNGCSAANLRQLLLVMHGRTPQVCFGQPGNQSDSKLLFNSISDPGDKDASLSCVNGAPQLQESSMIDTADHERLSMKAGCTICQELEIFTYA